MDKLQIVCATPGMIEIKGRTFIRRSVEVKLVNGKTINMQRYDTVEVKEVDLIEFATINKNSSAQFAIKRPYRPMMQVVSDEYIASVVKNGVR